MLVHIIKGRVIFLFFCFPFLSHAIMTERGKEITHVLKQKTHTQSYLKKSIKTDIKVSKINIDMEEGSQYDDEPQGLTRQQIIKRKQILHERKIRIQKFVQRLRKIREQKRIALNKI